MRLLVDRDGQDEQVLEVSPRQVLAWEKTFRNRSAVQLDGDAQKLEYLYEVAWVALGKPGKLDEFQDSTDVMFAPAAQDDDEDEDEDPGFTQPAVTTES